MYVIRERLVRLGEDSDITDEAGQSVLHVDGKVLSVHHRLILRDPAGREVGQVHRKLAALRPAYEITIDGKDVAEVRRHLFTPFGERFTVDVRGGGDMEIGGDLFSHEFTIGRDGRLVGQPIRSANSSIVSRPSSTAARSRATTCCRSSSEARISARSLIARFHPPVARSKPGDARVPGYTALGGCELPSDHHGKRAERSIWSGRRLVDAPARG
jgi:uncharacterized protein YxjI